MGELDKPYGAKPIITAIGPEDPCDDEDADEELAVRDALGDEDKERNHALGESETHIQHLTGDNLDPENFPYGTAE